MTLRLEPSDPEVRALTRRAIEASNNATPSLRVRCDQCRALLAQCGYTSAGPLFTSSWSVPIGAHLTVNGARLNMRQYRTSRQLGRDELLADEVHGVVALLALPPTLPQEFPDLLVRCQQHGDGVLDRVAILDALRGSERELFASVAFPRCEYEPSESSWLTDDTVTRQDTVHYGRPSPTTSDRL